MLGRFFNFQENPFNLTPDPRFFYANSMYREAYDKLYGVLKERKGYMALTGETGAGKTTLLKTLLNNLDVSYRCVYFEYSNLTFDDFLGLACKKLGLETERDLCGDVLKTFLIEQAQKGVTIAFIIDEAQNMPLASLVEILTFTNGMSEQENLVQILLSGQPQLETLLEHPQLLPLKEQFAIHYRLAPLPSEEVDNFIRHRLSIAGNSTGDIITSGAMQQVARHAGGRPRLINMLCSRALITAYATSQKRVSAEVMVDAIQDLREEQGDPINIRQQRPPEQVATGTAESTHNGPSAIPAAAASVTAPGNEVRVVMPWKEDERQQEHRFKTSLSTGIEATRKTLRQGVEKLSRLVSERTSEQPGAKETGHKEHPFKAFLLAGTEATRKALRLGMQKLSGLISELSRGKPGGKETENREHPFKTSLSAGIEATRKAFRPGIEKLSGLISRQPIGLGKGAAIAALVWLLIYPALEQKPETLESVVTGDMTAQTATIQKEHTVSLNAPSTAPEPASATPPSENAGRTFYASNQNGSVELIETNVSAVVTNQINDTVIKSQQDLELTLLENLPTGLTRLPGKAVATTADSEARQKNLEQKLRASEERLAQTEAELARNREELDKAHARIQENENKMAAYISEIGQLRNESNELKYRMVSFPEHLALKNISKTEVPDSRPAEQPRVLAQASSDVKRQMPIETTSRVDRLLERADELIKARHLTTPAGNNAFEIFSQVLKIDPNNEAGLNGIEQIRQQYLAWGARAQKKRDWLNAGNYYKKILAIDPSNPTAEAGLRESLEYATRSDEKAGTEALAKSRELEDARQRLAQMGIAATPKALLINAEQGNIDAVNALLAAGVSPDAKLSGGWTALMSAATHGHNVVVRTLLRQGADVNIKNDDGKTALTAAAWNGHSDVVKELLDNGARVNEQNNDGWTALMYAAWNGHRQVVETLLKGEAKIGVKDQNDWTALTAASSEGHVEIVKILEMAGGS